MKTNKNLKLAFNLFRIFGWLVVLECITSIVLALNGYSLDAESAKVLMYIFPLPFIVSSGQCVIYRNIRKKADSNYKTDMMPHYRSGYYTVLVLAVLAALSSFIPQQFTHVNILFLLGIAVYLTSYLTIVAVTKNDRI